MAEGGHETNEFNQTVIENLHIYGATNINESVITRAFIAGNNEVANTDDRQAQKDVSKEKSQWVDNEPEKNDKDLTWLVEGKIVMYKTRPLSKMNRKVFYGRQQFLPDLWREVAIKLVEYKEKNFRELRILLKLHHPNIVQMFDAGERRGDMVDYLYIVMELCAQNLRNYIDENPFNFETAFAFSKQLATGLAFLHQNQIIHRDLKPENILISLDQKSIKLSDFGLSKEIPSGQSAASVTTIGAGTEGFRSPETYKPNNSVSQSVDIFPCGLVIHFTFTEGEHPYGTNPNQQSYNIMENQNRDLTRVPKFNEPNGHKREQLLDLLNQTLEHNPRDRPTAEAINKHVFFTDVSPDDATVITEKQGAYKLSPTLSSSSSESNELTQASSNEKVQKIIPENAEGITELLDATKLSPCLESSPFELNRLDQATSTEKLHETIGDDVKRTSKVFDKIKSFVSTKSLSHESERVKETHCFSEVNEQLAEKSEANAKKIKEIEKKLSHEKKFRKIFQLLNELRQLRGSDDLDILLRLAECEIELKTGNDEESMRRVADFIRSSASHSIQYVREMGHDLQNSKSYVRALILYRISNDLHGKQNVTPDEEVKSIRDRVLDIKSVAKPLLKAGGRPRDIGTLYGLEYMKRLLGDLRSVKNANPDVRASNEVICLVNISASCIYALDYQQSIRFCQDGISIFEIQFGSNASNHNNYGQLLHNMGGAHHNYGNWLLSNQGGANVISEHYSKAEHYYVKAIEAKEKALDHENRKRKSESIEMTRQNLARVRRLIAKHK